VLLQSEITFARVCFELSAIEDLDPAAHGPDAARNLERVSDHGERGALNAQDVRARFLRHLEDIALEHIAGLKQPAAEARLDRVQRMAQGILLRLEQQEMDVAMDEVRKHGRTVQDIKKIRCRRAVCRATDLHNPLRSRILGPEQRSTADESFAPDEAGFYGAAVLAEGQKRNDARVRPVDMLDKFCGPMQDKILRQ
jgi:hypothetical protein